MTFEATLERLEAIVDELDSEGVDLERALRLFEEGVQRLRAATSELARAEAQVKQLVEHTDGTYELPDLAG
jgi:exodeoxyribonuclease VII small subunit